MNVVDTNVWVYSYDTRDPHKRAIARRLIVTLDDFLLPWQVGCEFMGAARKLAGIGFTNERA